MTLARVTRKQTASNSGGLVSFLTVARASANRMLDAPLGMVSSWTDGQPLYSSSFGGAGWHWQADFPAATATDNETTCRPTSWVAGGLNGAAVRNLQGNRTALTQAVWKVDSTATDNEGSGSALDPVKNDYEIQRRWGAGVPSLAAVQVAITYAQSPSNITNLKASIGTNGSLSILGTPTVTKPGTVITAVQAQVRTPGAEAGWAITAVGLGAGDVGKLAVITSSVNAPSIGAYARILKDETAGKVRVSPFGTYATSTAPFTQRTPVVGDVIEIRELSTVLSVGTIQLESEYQTTIAAAPARNVAIFDSIRLDGDATTFNGTIFSNRVNVHFARSLLTNLSICGQSASQAIQQMCGGGCGVAGGVGVIIRAGGFFNMRQPGNLGSCSAAPGSALTVGVDTYFQDSALTFNRGSIGNTQGVAMFDRTVSNAVLGVSPGAMVQHSGATADWGTNNAGHGITMTSLASYTYAVKPTINGTLGAGREALIGGVDTLYGTVPAITAANNAALVLTA